jgi:hypothetical protein
LRQQRLGDRPRPGAELDDRPGPGRIDIACHGAGERPAGRRHGAERQRLLDPGADETDFVVEADAVLLFEATDLRLDLLFLGLEPLLEFPAVVLELLLELALERALLLLEQLNVAADSPLELVPLQFEQPPLLLELLLEALQGWERHVGLNALQ